MKSVVAKSFIIGTAAILGLSVAAQAVPTIQLLGDTGTLRDTFYSTSITSLSNPTIPPYGTPVITPVTSGWKVVFAPSADFLAKVDNSTGGERQVFDGSLSFYITFDTPIHLTTNVYEDGLYQKTGNGQTSVTGGVIVSDANAVEASRSSLFPNATLSGGYWSLFDQVTGFSGTYFTYKISLDNILEAKSLASSTSDIAWISKKDFTFIFTTDGSSGGGVPEPASLGIMAMGCLALLARRRRA